MKNVSYIRLLRIYHTEMAMPRRNLWEQSQGRFIRTKLCCSTYCNLFIIVYVLVFSISFGDACVWWDICDIWNLITKVIKVTCKPEKKQRKKTKVGKVKVEPKPIGIAAITLTPILGYEIHAVWMTNWPFCLNWIESGQAYP